MPPYLARHGAARAIVKRDLAEAMLAGDLGAGLAIILLLEDGHNLGSVNRRDAGAICFHSPFQLLVKVKFFTYFSLAHF